MASLSARILVAISNFISRFWPANFDRYSDESAYSKWQMENAIESYEQYKEFQPFEGKKVLDLGSGEGGKTTYYADREPELMVGIDIDGQKIRRAKQFCSQNDPVTMCQFVVCSAHHQPFRQGFFDIVISEDCFDHYMEPDSVMREANRVLTKGGVFFVSFDTYYNWGGSHLYNFIRMPWAHLFFSDSALVEATRIIASQLTEENPTNKRRESYQEQAEREIYQFKHHVNKITLGGWRELVRNRDWRIVLEETQSSGKKIPIFNLPLLEELYNSLFYVLKKP